MQNSKVPIYLLIIVGLGLLVLSLAADALGVGSNVGFGPRQTAGTVAGVLILGVGLYYLRK